MRRILFVDDEPRILDGIENMLFDVMDEWEIETANDGVEALEALEDGEFDVLVTDMRMPRMDGATLLEEVRKKYPDLIRFVLSGHAEVEAMMRALPIAHQYLTKPCSSENLIMHLQCACDLLEALRKPSVAAVVGHLVNIPPRPEISNKVIMAMGDPKKDADAISRIIEQDPILTARLLQVSNTAFFARGRACMSVKDAVVRLGGNNLKTLLLGLEAAAAFSSTGCKSPGWLLKDSFQISCLAKIFGQEAGCEQEAFLAGILFNLGKLALWELDHDFEDSLRKKNGYACEAAWDEKDKFGINHTEVGGYVLMMWDFPFPVVEAIARYTDVAFVKERGHSPVWAVCVAVLCFTVLTEQEDVAESAKEALLELGNPGDVGLWLSKANKTLGENQ